MNLKIKEFKKEVNDCFSLIFDRPENFNFYPGQYLDITLPIKDLDKRGKVRAFTIASSPTEEFLQITSKRGISDFKKHIQNLKPGDEISATHPAGTFTLDETESAVFLAGGVGITPFRSIIKYALDQKLKNLPAGRQAPITLIYSNSNADFLFKEEFNEWQDKLPNLKIYYHNSSKKGRLNMQNLSTVLNSIYYLAGSWGFVDDMEKIILELGVDPLDIRYDRFDGYE